MKDYTKEEAVRRITELRNTINKKTDKEAYIKLSRHLSEILSDKPLVSYGNYIFWAENETKCKDWKRLDKYKAYFENLRKDEDLQ
jgi:hypothetical protein